MKQQKELTTQGLNIVASIYLVLALGMMAVSLYLTSHFFQTHFPSVIGNTSALCDINSFFNCDTASLSPASNIMGVPISFFGIIIGIFFVMSLIFPSSSMEKTASSISFLNSAGCLSLFAYSLIFLGSLCPFCTLYYLLSWSVSFLFYKYGTLSLVPELKITSILTILTLIGSSIMAYQYHEKNEKQEIVSQQIVEQYKNLENLGDPENVSPFMISDVPQGFSQAPIRLSVFSDFQCPFCARVSEAVHKLANQYKDKIAINYYFYPLDSSCNYNMKGNMHAYACQAAYIAACDQNKFLKIHDEIFENQDKISSDYLKSLVKKYQMENCLNNEELKGLVKTHIAQGDAFKVKSTPTLILNGKKIEGLIPNRQFRAIFDWILQEL